MSHKILHGDCLEVLKTLPDNSVDSLITDPPAGISFMGKAWDDDKGGRKQWIAWLSEVMSECKRVMKPGAHGLVWSLPRTSHWTATACDDAGFEIRDCVSHLFGSGFPKSLNVSKAMDKASGAEREVISEKKKLQSYGANEIYGDGPEKNGIQKITAPSTPAAKQWDGWGTALKPAVEMWWLIRKPLSEKTVAENVLKWGTGAIHVDGCRISTNGKKVWSIPKTDKIHDSILVYKNKPGAGSDSMMKNKGGREGPTTGRFPSNLVLSHSPHCTENQCDLECAIEMLDRQSGASKIKPRTKKSMLNKTSELYSGAFGGGSGHQLDDSGGASRFFYVAKVSTSERNAGLDGMPDVKQERYADGTKRKLNAYGENAENPNYPRKNHHPTVKPQKLMRYFCKLITPPGGIILDCFMGSGSTGLAAKSEGFQFIGIEKEAEYFEIAEKRIAHG